MPEKDKSLKVGRRVFAGPARQASRASQARPAASCSTSQGARCTSRSHWVGRPRACPSVPPECGLRVCTIDIIRSFCLVDANCLQVCSPVSETAVGRVHCSVYVPSGCLVMFHTGLVVRRYGRVPHFAQISPRHPFMFSATITLAAYSADAAGRSLVDPCCAGSFSCVLLSCHDYKYTHLSAPTLVPFTYLAAVARFECAGGGVPGVL